MAIEPPGDEKLPPTQICFWFESQNTALIWPLGDFEPRDAKEADVEV